MMRMGRAGGTGRAGFATRRETSTKASAANIGVWAVPPWKMVRGGAKCTEWAGTVPGRKKGPRFGVFDLLKDGQAIEYEWKLFCIVELACTAGKFSLGTGVL